MMPGVVYVVCIHGVNDVLGWSCLFCVPTGVDCVPGFSCLCCVPKLKLWYAWHELFMWCASINDMVYVAGVVMCCASMELMAYLA